MFYKIQPLLIDIKQYKHKKSNEEQSLFRMNPMFFTEKYETVSTHAYDLVTPHLHAILFSIALTAGIVSNLLCIVVFAQKNMRQLLTFKLLLNLCVVDTLILVTCALENSRIVNLDVDFRQISAFMTIFLRQTRSLLFAGVTMEQILLIWPLKDLKKRRSIGSVIHKFDTPSNRLTVISKPKHSRDGTCTQTILSLNVKSDELRCDTPRIGRLYVYKSAGRPRSVPTLFTKILLGSLSACFLVNVHCFLVMA